MMRYLICLLAMALLTACAAAAALPTPTTLPAATDDLPGRPILTAGAAHTCLVDTVGQVTCWGDNQFGQLGGGDGPYRLLEYGPPTEENTSWVLAAVGLGQPAAAIAAGMYHTCAALEDGAVRCWGRNDQQQLGTGSTSESRSPLAVAGLAGKAVALTAGFEHTCALLENGVVQCWGGNAAGQLGGGQTSERGPVAVAGLDEPARQAAAGGTFTCALLDSGDLACWGSADNDTDPAGPGGLVHPAIRLALDEPARAIAAGLYHICTLLPGERVKCWVDMSHDLDFAPSNPSMTAALAAPIGMLSAGGGFTCALTGAGGVLCWGENYFGQLGDGSDLTQLEPVEAQGLASGVVALAAGHGHACAALADGSLRCWGDASAGQLGDRAITWK